ncbi:MAG: flagellar basal body rod protein FlgB [Myxococcota bacterium]
MERLLAGPIGVLEDAMRFRATRQGVLAANVANADTPGYRRMDIEFQDALDRAAETLEATRSRHLTAGPEGVRVVRGPRGTRPDGNGIDRDQEALTLSRNAGAFTKQANILSRVYVIARIAATGEQR